MMPQNSPAIDNPDQLISLNAGSEMLDVTPAFLRRRIAEGALTGYRLGGRIMRVRRGDVMALAQPIPTVGTHR